VNGCGTGRGLTRCLTHVSGEVTAKMDALPYRICDDFFSAIAVMYVYECIPPKKSRACSPTKTRKCCLVNYILLQLFQLFLLLYWQSYNYSQLYAIIDISTFNCNNT
jgi:hypothetical protein